MLGRVTIAFGVATVIGILAASTPADAGLIQSFPVVIDPVNRVASGSLGSARNSGDLKQYIGCYNQISGYFDDDPTIKTTDPMYPLQVHATGLCYAADANNNYVQCAIAPGEVAPMAPDSLVAFTWDANGNCTGLQVWTYSQTSPKR